jgi:hypothetical protein
MAVFWHRTHTISFLSLSAAFWEWSGITTNSAHTRNVESMQHLLSHHKHTAAAHLSALHSARRSVDACVYVCVCLHVYVCACVSSVRVCCVYVRYRECMTAHDVYGCVSRDWEESQDTISQLQEQLRKNERQQAQASSQALTHLALLSTPLLSTPTSPHPHRQQQQEFFKEEEFSRALTTIAHSSSPTKYADESRPQQLSVHDQNMVLAATAATQEAQLVATRLHENNIVLQVKLLEGERERAQASANEGEIRQQLLNAEHDMLAAIAATREAEQVAHTLRQDASRREHTLSRHTADILDEVKSAAFEAAGVVALARALQAREEAKEEGDKADRLQQLRGAAAVQEVTMEVDAKLGMIECGMLQVLALLSEMQLNRERERETSKARLTEMEREMVARGKNVEEVTQSLLERNQEMCELKLEVQQLRDDNDASEKLLKQVQRSQQLELGQEEEFSKALTTVAHSSSPMNEQLHALHEQNVALQVKLLEGERERAKASDSESEIRQQLLNAIKLDADLLVEDIKVYSSAQQDIYEEIAATREAEQVAHTLRQDASRREHTLSRHTADILDEVKSAAFEAAGVVALARALQAREEAKEEESKDTQKQLLKEVQRSQQLELKLRGKRERERKGARAAGRALLGDAGKEIQRFRYHRAPGRF